MNPRLQTAIEGTVGMLENLIDRGGSREAVTAMINELKAAASEPVRFAIFLDGGLIQEVYTDQPAQMIKVDLDIDGADESELTEYPDRFSKPSVGFVTINVSEDYPHSLVEEDAEYVERLFKSQG